MNKNLYRLFAGGIFIAKLFDSIKRLFVNSWGTEKIEKSRQRVRIKNPLIIFDEKKYVECGYGIF